MKTPYDDIIRLPRHVPQNHPQMPLRDRAAQLAPFAALTGDEAAVGETARLTTERRELDAQEAAELNRRLTDLAARLKDRPEVTIEYFVPDERKAGGAYVTVTGVVRNISIAERIVVKNNFPERAAGDGNGPELFRSFRCMVRFRFGRELLIQFNTAAQIAQQLIVGFQFLQRLGTCFAFFQVGRSRTTHSGIFLRR